MNNLQKLLLSPLVTKVSMSIVLLHFINKQMFFTNKMKRLVKYVFFIHKYK